MLHFFVEEEDQNAYFRLLKELVKEGGHVIIAVFNLQGAEKCSGLPVFRSADRAVRVLRKWVAVKLRREES